MLISLEDIPKHNEMEVGLKAWNLSRVRAAGIDVPFTLIVPSDVISEILSKSGVRHDVFKLSRLIKGLEDPEEALMAEKEIRSKINSLSLSEELIDEMMSSMVGNFGRMIIARPSPYASELADGDMKGRMGVWYDEPTKRGIVRSIQRVLGGAFSLRALARMMDLGIYPEDLDLAIIIQRAILPRSSGIAICCPARRRNEVLIESTWGAMDGVLKDRFRINIDLMEVVESELSEKKTMLIPSPQGIREMEVPNHLWIEPSIRGSEIEEISRVSSDLSLIFGTPTLVEWIIQEGNDSLYVIQAHKESERPPVKALERKVLNWLSVRKEVKGLSEEAGFKGGEGMAVTTAQEAGLTVFPIVGSKIYLRSGKPVGFVDGLVISPEDLHGIEEGEYLLLISGKSVVESEVQGEGIIRVAVDAESIEEAKERIPYLTSLFPESDFLIYLRKPDMVLRSGELSSLYDGAIIPIDLKGFEKVLLVVASAFDYFMVDLGNSKPPVDMIVDAMNAGVYGFLLNEETLSHQLAIISRAEMRYLLRKLRYWKSIIDKES